MAYVSERASQYELMKTLHIWQRKVEIAEVNLASLRHTHTHTHTHMYIVHVHVHL